MAGRQELWSTHELILGWVRFADAKAGAVLAGNLGLAALTVSAFNHSGVEAFRAYHGLSICAVLGLLAVASSTLAAGACLVPRVKTSQARTLVFFGHIAGYASREEYLSDIERRWCDDKDFDAQLGGQIWDNARVAKVKMRTASLAVWLFGLALLFAGVGCALVLFQEWHW